MQKGGPVLSQLFEWKKLLIILYLLHYNLLTIYNAHQNLFYYCRIKCVFFCNLQNWNTTFGIEDISKNIIQCNLCSHYWFLQVWSQIYCMWQGAVIAIDKSLHTVCILIKLHIRALYVYKWHRGFSAFYTSVPHMSWWSCGWFVLYIQHCNIYYTHNSHTHWSGGC